MGGRAVADEIDFEAEGLLKGTRGKAREARRRLLAELAGDGVSLDELRHAVAEDRLALLPVERELGGGDARYTANQIAELSGLEREMLDRDQRALGMALADPDEVAYTDADLEGAQRVAALRGAGVPDEEILEVARVLGVAMSQVAAAARSTVGGAFAQRGDTEYDLALRFRDVARGLTPLLGDSLTYILNLHLREQLRHDAISAEQVAAGDVAGAAEVTVCFADLVGFTRLGERLPAEELGTLSRRLWALASGVAQAPVRLVKLIGDAAMLVGPDAHAVVDAALALLDAAEAEGDGFPVLRAGVATGAAVARGGDYYGRPVNLASRITTRARPGSVLASEAVHDALSDGYRWSFAGAKRLRGIEGEVKLYRCRRLD
ncbi:MAG: adenylate cyclase regulatory domain-containing protein [Solirubrobacterales bacterium]